MKYFMSNGQKKDGEEQDHRFKQILIHILETLNIEKQWNCITTSDHHIEQLHYKKNHIKGQKIAQIETEETAEVVQHI